MTAEMTLEQMIRNEQANASDPDAEVWEYGNPSVLQSLIDSGDAWHLEGSAGRAASDALASGVCFLPSVWTDGVERPMNNATMKEFAAVLKRPMRDYYGNVIPYREMVQPGTKGTLEKSRQFYGL